MIASIFIRKAVGDLSLIHKKEVMWKQSRERLENVGLEDWSCIATIQGMPAAIRTWKRQGMDGLGRTSRWGRDETSEPSQILSGYVHFHMPRNMLESFKVPYIHSASHIFLMSFLVCLSLLQQVSLHWAAAKLNNCCWLFSANDGEMESSTLWALNEILKGLSLWMGFSVSWVKWWLFLGHGSFGDILTIFTSLVTVRQW